MVHAYAHAEFLLPSPLGVRRSTGQIRPINVCKQGFGDVVGTSIRSHLAASSCSLQVPLPALGQFNGTRGHHMPSNALTTHNITIQRVFIIKTCAKNHECIDDHSGEAFNAEHLVKRVCDLPSETVLRNMSV